MLNRKQAYGIWIAFLGMTLFPVSAMAAFGQYDTLDGLITSCDLHHSSTRDIDFQEAKNFYSFVELSLGMLSANDDQIAHTLFNNFKQNFPNLSTQIADFNNPIFNLKLMSLISCLSQESGTANIPPQQVSHSKGLEVDIKKLVSGTHIHTGFDANVFSDFKSLNANLSSLLFSFSTAEAKIATAVNDAEKAKGSSDRATLINAAKSASVAETALAATKDLIKRFTLDKLAPGKDLSDINLKRSWDEVNQSIKSEIEGLEARYAQVQRDLTTQSNPDAPAAADKANPAAAKATRGKDADSDSDNGKGSEKTEKTNSNYWDLDTVNANIIGFNMGIQDKKVGKDIEKLAFVQGRMPESCFNKLEKPTWLSPDETSSSQSCSGAVRSLHFEDKDGAARACIENLKAELKKEKKAWSCSNLKGDNACISLSDKIEKQNLTRIGTDGHVTLAHRDEDSDSETLVCEQPGKESLEFKTSATQQKERTEAKLERKQRALEDQWNIFRNCRNNASQIGLARGALKKLVQDFRAVDSAQQRRASTELDRAQFKNLKLAALRAKRDELDAARSHLVEWSENHPNDSEEVAKHLLIIAQKLCSTESSTVADCDSAVRMIERDVFSQSGEDLRRDPTFTTALFDLKIARLYAELRSEHVDPNTITAKANILFHELSQRAHGACFGGNNLDSAECNHIMEEKNLIIAAPKHAHDAIAQRQQEQMQFNQAMTGIQNQNMAGAGLPAAGIPNQVGPQFGLPGQGMPLGMPLQNQMGPQFGGFGQGMPGMTGMPMSNLGAGFGFQGAGFGGMTPNGMNPYGYNPAQSMGYNPYGNSPYGMNGMGGIAGGTGYNPYGMSPGMMYR